MTGEPDRTGHALRRSRHADRHAIRQDLRFGRTRTTVGIDLYNITNSAAVLTYNQTFVPTTDTWLRPNSVLQARFMKLSAQMDF